MFSLQATLKTMRKTISISLSPVATPTKARAHTGILLVSRALLVGGESRPGGMYTQAALNLKLSLHAAIQI